MSKAGRTATVFLTLLALSAQFCPCPANADTVDPAPSGVHHEHAAPDEAVSDCHGGESRDDCTMAASSAPEASPKTNTLTPDAPAVPASFVVASPHIALRHAVQRPPDHTAPAPSSPVLRADRLLH